MILTNCAACAAPLAHDAPRCVRCKTRYCNATCQHDECQRRVAAGGQDHPLLTGENDEHAPSPTDVFAAEPYINEEGSPKKKQRVA